MSQKLNNEALRVLGIGVRMEKTIERLEDEHLLMSFQVLMGGVLALVTEVTGLSKEELARRLRESEAAGRTAH